jgi:uncharacterized membrane protein YgcG
MPKSAKPVKKTAKKAAAKKAPAKKAPVKKTAKKAAVKKVAKKAPTKKAAVKTPVEVEVPSYIALTTADKEKTESQLSTSKSFGARLFYLNVLVLFAISSFAFGKSIGHGITEAKNSSLPEAAPTKPNSYSKFVSSPTTKLTGATTTAIANVLVPTTPSPNPSISNISERTELPTTPVIISVIPTPSASATPTFFADPTTISSYPISSIPVPPNIGGVTSASGSTSTPPSSGGTGGGTGGSTGGGTGSGGTPTPRPTPRPTTHEIENEHSKNPTPRPTTTRTRN